MFVSHKFNVDSRSRKVIEGVFRMGIAKCVSPAFFLQILHTPLMI